MSGLDYLNPNPYEAYAAHANRIARAQVEQTKRIADSLDNKDRITALEAELAEAKALAFRWAESSDGYAELNAQLTAEVKRKDEALGNVIRTYQSDGTKGAKQMALFATKGLQALAKTEDK